jgi:hypothetical protein
MTLKSSYYRVNVLNAVGQTIFEQNMPHQAGSMTEGILSVNVSTWTNGIYLFEITDKATHKQQRSKIMVKH